MCPEIEPCEEPASVRYNEVVPHSLLGVGGVGQAINCDPLRWAGAEVSHREALKMCRLIPVESIVGAVNVVQIACGLTSLHLSDRFIT